MKTWKREAIGRLCGGVHHEPRSIVRGEPVLVMQIAGIQRRFYRCVECAGPAPPDLSPLPVRGRVTKPMTPIAHFVAPLQTVHWAVQRSTPRAIVKVLTDDTLA